MATSEEVDLTAVSGSDKEPPAQEVSAGESHKTPDRRHVEDLLDVSEEDFMKELEPFEYHCYSGWEEAVNGWARVAPLSCILVTQKRYKKPKHKETDNPAPASVDPTIPDADSSASTAEHHCESHVGPSNSLKKSMPLNQHTGPWSCSAVAALQKDVMKNMSNLLLEEKAEEEGPLSGTPLQNRPAKPQKQSHRANNAVVPIKNFTFLPPIKSPHLDTQRFGQLWSGKKAPEGETTEENCFMFEQKSGTRGTRVDPVANAELYPAGLTSKYRTCQHNPHLFSALSVSIPKRCPVPAMSSKRDAAHRSSFSMGRSLKQAQRRLRPSKTVCAVTLYKGCQINV